MGSQRVLNSLQKFTAALLIAAVLLIALTALGGWFTDHARLAAVLPGIHRMTFNTALGFLLMGGVCLLPLILRRPMREAQRFIGGVVFLVAGASLLQDLASIELGLDEFFLDQSLAYHDSPHPGRMSPFTAFSFALTAGLLMLSTRLSAPRYSLQLVTALLLLMTVAVLNLVMRGLFPATPAPFIHLLSMSPFTAIAFLLLSATLWINGRALSGQGQWSGMAPGIALMQRLKFAWKFRLLLFIVLLPLGYGMSFMATTVSDNINQSREQQLGLKYTRAISVVLELIPQHRGLANSYLRGDHSLHPQIERVRLAIDEQIGRVNTFQKQHNIYPELIKKWSLLQLRWSAIAATMPDISPSESWRAHSLLIADIIEFSQDISTEMSAGLNEDVAARHLANSVFDHLPELMESLGQLRGLGTGFLDDAGLESSERTALAVLHTRIEGELQSVEGHLSKVIVLRPALAEFLEAPLAGLLAAADAYQLLLVTEAPSSSTIMLLPGDYFAQGTKVIKANSRLLGVTSRVLNQYFEQQLATQYAHAYRATLLAVVTLALMFYLWAAFRHSLRHSVDVMASAAYGLLHNKPAASIPIGGSDELAEMVGSFNDVAEVTGSFNEVAERLESHNTWLKTVMDHVHEGIMTINPEGRIESANQAVAKMFGYEVETLVGKNISLLMPESSRQAYAKGFRHYVARSSYKNKMPGRELLLQGGRQDGSCFPLELHVNEVRLAGKLYFLGAMRDITRRKRRDAELKMLATTDSLTGVRNRRDFLFHGERELARSCRYQQPLAFIMLDIDNFKSINDRYGHPVGDQVLKAVSRCCTDVLRENDIFGRVGGEEFAVALPQTSLAEAANSAERLRVAVAALVVPLEDGDSVNATISLGVAELEEGASQFDELFKRADSALYRAKENGRNRFELWADSGPKSSNPDAS